MDDPVAAEGMRRASPSQELREVRVDLIEPNLSQPRRYLDEGTLKELAGSIGERGVLQPVLVRPLKDGRYKLVAGERRWRAAKLAGLQSIPALVSGYDDLGALEVGLIENMAREDLNPVEEARACQTLVKELGLTQEQVGRRVGRSLYAVSKLMRLLDLPVEILELLERGELSAGHGRALLMAKDLEVRRQLAGAAIQKGWSVRTLEARAHENNESRQDPEEAGFDWEKEEGKEGDGGQAEDQLLMNLARVWGDALGVEVSVRALRGRKLRLEVVFDSPQQGLALGGLIGEKIARGSKRK